MKVCIVHIDNEYNYTEVSIYFPYLCFNKVGKPDIGDPYSRTIFDFPTIFSIIATKYSLKFSMRLLGFGFKIYSKEKQ